MLIKVKVALSVIIIIIQISLTCQSVEKEIQPNIGGHLDGDLKYTMNVDEYENYVEEDAPDCRGDQDMPIIVWWTPFTGALGMTRHCALGSCCLTQDRSQLLHPNAKVVLFYGTDFDPTDLPLPRRKDIWWGLLHEESPKNKPILNHLPVIQTFNITATFKRESDFPLTLQFLPSIDSLTSRKYFISTNEKNKYLNGLCSHVKDRKMSHLKPTEKLPHVHDDVSYYEDANQFDKKRKANSMQDDNEENCEESFIKIAPVAYIHSDCDSPSERDQYMAELSKYIKIDSLGNCLNTKLLPVTLQDPSNFNHPDLMRILARYKFILSIENYGCDDYLTEKFWRPLIVGSVPVYWGSPTVDDWAPNPRSFIKISDFASPKDLADYLYTLLRNDSLYETYLTHKIHKEIKNSKLTFMMNKRQWGLDDFEKGSFIDHFECHVCDEVYYNHPHFTSKTMYTTKIANNSHCYCPEPKTVLKNKANKRSYWLEEYEKSKTEAKVLETFLKSEMPLTEDEFYSKVFESLRAEGFFKKFPLRHNHEEL